MPAWVTFLGTGVNSFSIGLIRNRYKSGEWILLINPRDDRSLWRRLHSPYESRNNEELKLIVSDLHSALVQMRDVTDLRWYFKEDNRALPAVATPEELPWAGNR